MIFQVEDTNSIFYAYDFINPRKLAYPIKITKTGKVWTEIEDMIKKQFIFQESLF